MTMSNRFLRFTSLLVWLVSLGAGAFISVSTALAAPSENGYSLTLTESASSMYYGNLTPTFQAFLTVPANEPPMPTYGITLVVDGALSITGDVTGSAPNYTLTVPASSSWRFEPGPPHTIVAKYLSVPLDQYIYSQQLTFTVNKGNATLTCPLGNPLPPYGTNTYPAHASLDMGFLVHNSYTGGTIDVDVQNATYTVIFVGAQTFTYADIKPASPNFTYASITSPSVPGNYTMRCIFKGTGHFNSTEADTHVTLQSTSGTPSPTPASQTPGPGSTPTGSGTPSQPGATATSTGASTVTATPTVASTVTVTATATSGLLLANTASPPSSTPSTALLWMLAAAVVCSGVGGLGFLFWRKRKLPTSLTAQSAIASNTASTSDESRTSEPEA